MSRKWVEPPLQRRERYIAYRRHVRDEVRKAATVEEAARIAVKMATDRERLYDHAAEFSYEHRRGWHRLHCKTCRRMLVHTTRIGRVWWRFSNDRLGGCCTYNRFTGKKRGWCGEHVRADLERRLTQLRVPTEAS